MKIKTSELIGAQLDWAVAVAVSAYCQETGSNDLHSGKHWVIPGFKPMRWDDWTPSADWSQGGPLIERFKVHIAYDLGRGQAAVRVPTDRGMKQGGASGETHLIAAMRAIVAAKLGEEIEVPEELQS